MNESFGAYVAELRQKWGFSQKELGELVDRSQATISRIEGAEEVPEDLRLVAKLGRVFNMSFKDFINDFDAPSANFDHHVDANNFFAFCPDPFCDSNRVVRGSDGEVVVEWTSAAHYDLRDYNEINFCERCGRELLKECHSCNKPIRSADARFCTTCGATLNPHPTSEERERLEEMNLPEKEPDDDLRF